MNHVLTIAGSDCSGGAGIQADMKTFAAHGVYGMSVIVSVVAENTQRVIGAQDISPTLIAEQLQAVFEDIRVDAVKIGMLPSPAIMACVAENLERRRPRNIVLDPVMIAKNGYPLMDSRLAETLVALVFPLVDVVTPNIPEAEVLANMTISSTEAMETAARIIHAYGPRYVVLKGGHRSDDAADLLYDGNTMHWLRAKRIETKNTHGTGCTFSSAIAANLAMGKPIDDAVRDAKAYVTMAIAHALTIGKGCGPTHHFHDLYKYGLPRQGAQK
ncbi:MAG: bifunctional hydroxymethylpyrimidine kinase/phosphomethylpyrimidine kinase [Sphaerochaeta sp.]|nr:bifunctional hydroxymethylpyrimidine kinase/phosphomethylpyrimidine kinase [Sphaerochaeta sp.]MDD3929278.1 bifunctional hydroxymethylpyrimidine kinase/phosphomethylpyrimidine kinase [Sphaerochaeta sp.]NCC90626.1 bifunctional hydroxymethylpyrimidine kinase/phosphomethylpyrimidine kinase [Spirochaetia bacterium]